MNTINTTSSCESLKIFKKILKIFSSSSKIIIRYVYKHGTMVSRSPKFSAIYDKKAF